MDKKVTIIGFFAYNTEYNGGQENKTRALADLFKERLGKDNIYTVDTLEWKKRPLKLLYETFVSVRKSNIVIMLPAKNGVKVFSKLLLMFKKKNTKLFYSVIGGWLPTITESNEKLKRNLTKFDGIWVETKSMHDDLIKQKFNNITIVPNFKKIKPISRNKINTNYRAPYKICTFSRVLREKGIEDAINVIKKINDDYGKVIFELDIYGKIDSNYEIPFKKIMANVPSYIKYQGVVPYNNTVEVLENYFFLLFPTHYSTEGIPGTIIDAYASALPIVSAKWNSYNDVIIDNKTGIGFEQKNNKDLEKVLINIINNPKIIISKKEECLAEFVKYTEEYVFSIIEKEI